MYVCASRGGGVIVNVPAKDSPDYQRMRLWHKCGAKGKENDWHYFGRRISDEELHDLLTNARLRNIELFHLGTPLRGVLITILKYFKSFFKKPSICAIKGTILEVKGIIISSKLFRFLTFDFILKRYMKTRGYYLFSKANKITSSKNQNVNIKIRSYDDLYTIVMCPKCHRDLHKKKEFLVCDYCNIKYPLKDHIPFLTVNDAIKISSV